jgi:hypothetical protein
MKILPILFLSAIAPSPALAQPNLDNIPWDERTWEQRFVQSSYEDEFTFKHGKIFAKDPFVWTISKEFSDRFGMPKQWIDPELKGALAVAWRTTTIGQTFCGHGGNPNACWPAFTCQMDIYVDSNAPIPWRFNDVERDFLWPGLSSMDYVPRRTPAPRRSLYTFEDGSLGSKGTPFYNTSWEYKNGNRGGGAFVITHFDRAYAPGVILLGFTSACPSHVSNGAAALKFFTEEEQNKTRGLIKNFTHSVEFSEIFMQKITAIYRQEREENNKTNSAYQQIMQRYFPGAKQKTQ